VSSATLQLWEHLFGELEGYLATFTGKQSERQDARTNELDDTKQILWTWPAGAEKAAAYVQRESDAGRDVYFGVHLFKTSANRKAENTAGRIGALWVDGDGAKVPEKWPQPTAVIESSPGREHFYWKLARPVDPQTAAQLNKRLAYGMGGDHGKWGLGTVLRAPGTYNYKRAEPTEVGGGVVA
jgi:hypothetical protein